MVVHLENERTLLDQARVGNHEAFETLIKHYDKKILRLTFRITGNREDADDALQESFMKAYLNLGLFHGDSRFYTWLARIAVNEALTKLRKHVNHRQVSLEENPPQCFVDSAETPEQRCARAERRRLLSQAVEELEPSLRAAIALRYGDELSNAEIGRRLNLSVPAVKSRLMRARMRLRQQLWQHVDGGAVRHGRRRGPLEFRRPKPATPELPAVVSFPAAVGATGAPGDVFILPRAGKPECGPAASRKIRAGNTNQGRRQKIRWGRFTR